MNATPTNISDPQKDAEMFLKLLLFIDPKAAHGNSSAYREVRAKLRAIGWTPRRFDEAVRHLYTNGRLFLSRSRKTVSLKPFHKTGVKLRCCVYCGRVAKNLTKDHVVPKSKGGATGASNIVLACKPCNQVKADRTPAQWAQDILNYDKRAS